MVLTFCVWFTHTESYGKDGESTRNNLTAGPGWEDAIGLFFNNFFFSD